MLRRIGQAAAAILATLTLIYLFLPPVHPATPPSASPFPAAVRRAMEAERRISLEQDERVARELAAGTDIDDVGRRANRAIEAALTAVDLTACPPDFQEAFLRHRDAMRDYCTLSDQYGGWAGRLGGVAELWTTGKNPSDRFKAATDLINERRLQLERIALRYGVQLGTR